MISIIRSVNKYVGSEIISRDAIYSKLVEMRTLINIYCKVCFSRPNALNWI